jgi:hypothetical protein
MIETTETRAVGEADATTEGEMTGRLGADVDSYRPGSRRYVRLDPVADNS